MLIDRCVQNYLNTEVCSELKIVLDSLSMSFRCDTVNVLNVVYLGFTGIVW